MNENIRCRALAENGSRCKYKVINNNQCCTRCHADMENYTDEMFANLKLCKNCPRPRWRYFPDSDRCFSCQKKRNICMGKQKNGNPCKKSVMGNNRFCMRNHKYMETYTNDMLNNLKKCSGCNREIYAGYFNEDLKTCIDCQSKCENNRKKQRKYNETKEKCIYNDCMYLAKEKGYCAKHKLQIFVNETEQKKLKVCGNYLRGCRVRLSLDYPKKKCDTCLEKQRQIDNKRYNKKKEKMIKNRNDEIFYCIECKQSRNISSFLKNNNKYSLTCLDCRNIKAKRDRNRNRQNVKTNEHVIKEIIKCANKRKIRYELDFDFALKKIKESCYYCGQYESKKNDYGVEYSSMSFDRYDNDKYYTADNIVTACTKCNFMKYTHTVDDFIRYCKNIYDNFGSENYWTPDEWKHVRYGGINRHRNDCRRHGKKTEITKKQYENIVSKKCYYCNNTNNPYQIGIDRIDSNIGYTSKNKLVASCGICNFMKKDVDIDSFYNKILEILLFNGYIDHDIYNSKLRIIKRKTKFEWVAQQLSKIFKYDDKNNKDRRKIYNFPKPSKHYINMIWKGFAIDNIEPELEFCEEQEQIHIWSFYRLTISSHYPSKINNLDIKILIRDRFTKKYIGITGLCVSRPNWSDRTTIGKIIKHKNVYNISTCVAIPPFSYNFNVGKLITMLMFSKEVYEYMLKKNIILAGLMTYSLHGDSVQYDNLDELKCVGHTKPFGSDNTRVPAKVYDNMKKIMRKKKMPILKHKINNVKLFCSKFGIIDASYHGIKRGIYFGTTGRYSLEYLNEKTLEFVPNLDTVETIAQKWYVKYAIPRINDLIKRNKIMVNYDYDTYYADESSYNRNKKKKCLMKHKSVQDDINDQNRKRQIINHWILNRTNTSLTQMAKYLKNNKDIDIDRRSISKLIFHDTYDITNKNIIDKIQKHVKIRNSLLIDASNDIIKSTRIDNILINEFDYIDNKNNINVMEVNLKKPKLYVLSQKYDKLELFSRTNYKYENIKTGIWILSSANDYDNILSMRYKNIENIEKYDVSYNNFDQIIFKLCISQTDREIKLSNLNIINSPLKITGKNNIFCDATRKKLTRNIKSNIGLIYDTFLKKYIIVSIDLTVMSMTNCYDKYCICNYCHSFRTTLCTHCDKYNELCEKYIMSLTKQKNMNTLCHNQ